MSRLLGAIVYNWPLKLMAIVLATLLYAGLVVSQSTFELPTSLQIVPLNQPLNAVVLGNLPPVSRVRYVANGDVGAGPTPDSFRATIDLSGVNPEAGSTYVKIDVQSNDPRFLAVDWEPRGINVQLDPFKTYKVPVRVNTGSYPDNLVVRKPELSASMVSVSGPDSVVKFVVAAQADVLIDPSGLPVDRDVPLIPVDQLGKRLTPVQLNPATVHVTIAVFSNARKKALVVNPVVTGTPPTGYIVDTVTVTPLTVTVEGNADQLATLVRAAIPGRRQGERRARGRAIVAIEILFEYLVWTLQWPCGLADWIIRLPLVALALAGIEFRAFLSVTIRIVTDQEGAPAVPPETARRWLFQAQAILGRSGIALVPDEIEFLPREGYLCSTACTVSSVFQRFFTWFSSRARGGSRRVTIFVVKSIRGASGCSYPGSDWVLVGADADGAVIVHEIGHLCGLWTHSRDPDNLMTVRSGGSHDRLTRGQRSMIRTSRFASVFPLRRSTGT